MEEGFYWEMVTYKTHHTQVLSMDDIQQHHEEFQRIGGGHSLAGNSPANRIPYQLPT